MGAPIRTLTPQHYLTSELPNHAGWSAANDRPGAPARRCRFRLARYEDAISVRWEQSATEDAEMRRMKDDSRAV